MEMKLLAQQIGISHQMANRYKRQGMPTDSLESAIAWREANIDPFRSKTGRIGGNTGKRYGASKTGNDDLISRSIKFTLTDIVPRLWFGQIGWLGAALRDHGVKDVTAEQLIKIQGILFLRYMIEVDDFLKTENENDFTLPEPLMAKPGVPMHQELIERLNEILNDEPINLYEN